MHGPNRPGQRRREGQLDARGAEVCLLKKAIYDTSDASGAFVLTDVAVLRETLPILAGAPFVGKNGLLTITLDKNEPVSIRTYSLNGKLMSSMEEQWQAGSYAIPSPVKASGIYVYRIRIGDRAYSMKFMTGGNRSGAGVRFRQLETYSLNAGFRAGKQSSSSIADTVMATMDGYYPAKVPVALVASNIQVLLRKVSLKNGVKPGVMTGATSQGKTFAISIGPNGKTIDSIEITAIMQDCPGASYTNTFSIPGPITIPDNGVVTLGDSIKLVFFDSTVSGSFYTSQSIMLTTSDACYTSQLIIIGGGYIIQELPYYYHNFRLNGPVKLYNSLFTLTVNQSHGNVTKNPDKPSYLPGESVDLTATPDSLYRFSGWTGDVSTLSGSTAHVVMNNNKAITANFIKNYVLTTTIQNGTLSRYPDNTSYAPGDTVRLEAVPDLNYYCTGWSGDTMRISADTAWVIMNKDKQVEVKIAGRPVLTTTVQNGTIYRFPDKTLYASGDTVRVVAIPDPNFCCAKWSGDTLRTLADTAWVIIIGPKSITAYFKAAYCLTIIAEHGRVIKVPDKTCFDPAGNDTVMLIAKPDSGYLFKGWSLSAQKTSHDTAWLLMYGDFTDTGIFLKNYVHVKYHQVSNQINSVGFSPDGSKVALGADDSVTLWEKNTGAYIRKVASGLTLVYALKFSSDGTKILTASWWGRSDLWDAASGMYLQTYSGNQRGIYSVAFSPDESKLLSGSYDGSTKLWQTSTGKELLTLTGPMNSVNSVSFSPDGSKIITGSADSAGRLWDGLWDASTGALLKTFTGNSNIAKAITFTPSGSTFWSFSTDGTVQLMDITTGATLQTNKTGVFMAQCAAFSPDRSKVATGAWSDYGVKVWETTTGKLLQECMGHTAPVLSIAFSPDGSQLLTGSMDSTAILWDVK